VGGLYRHALALLRLAYMWPWTSQVSRNFYITFFICYRWWENTNNKYLCGKLQKEHLQSAMRAVRTK